MNRKDSQRFHAFGYKKVDRFQMESVNFLWRVVLKRYCTERLFYMQREVFVWYSDKYLCALDSALFWHCLLNGLPNPSEHNRCSSPDALSAAFRTGCICIVHSAAG